VLLIAGHLAFSVVAKEFNVLRLLSRTDAHPDDFPDDDLDRRDGLHASFDAMVQELERKNAALAEALDKSESASRAKSEFLANISHELRTPLNAIIGFAELIMTEMHGPLGSERYRDYIGDIRDSGSHLLRIINDILDLSKAEAGKMDLAEDLVDPADIIASVCRLVRHRTEAARLEITTQVAPGLPALRADERKLKQILLNLLSNSVKFTPAGGRIAIEAEVSPADELRIAVRDSGIGIPAEDIERVLEPFAQVDASLSRKYEGTGLGLPLVKAMVELHGGRLELESRPDEGTCATLVFPAARVLAEPAMVEPRAKP
jgi:signal transduction histidine kinase